MPPTTKGLITGSPCSASVGIPPLLAMAAVAGVLKMPMWVFVPTVLVGRSLRFGLLFLGADFALQ